MSFNKTLLFTPDDLAELEILLSMHAPSGEEFRVKEFILNYVRKYASSWTTEPVIHDHKELHDALILSFGNPKVAHFAHMDTVGFTCRYENQLVNIGSPQAATGAKLTGKDSMGVIETELKWDDDGHAFHTFPRSVERGTSLIYSPNFSVTDEFIQSPYLDNRLGVFCLLKLAEKLKNGLLVFTTYEEHGGGCIPKILPFIMSTYAIHYALVADITWVTDGIFPGKGTVISLRDRNIPRRKFMDKILSYAHASNIPFQIEVEGSGSSDGREIHHSAYPIDWVFIGAPEENVHTPEEKVVWRDFIAMIDLHFYLSQALNSQ